MKCTSYDEVFVNFKDKITDPDLLLFSNDLQVEMLISYMNKAISKCNRIVKPTVDLSMRDDTILEFQVYIPDDVMDILTEWMTVFWLEPYLNNMENLKNALSTKDFSVFSPANLLEKISDRYTSARKYARSVMNEYSYIIADMKELKS